MADLRADALDRARSRLRRACLVSAGARRREALAAIACARRSGAGFEAVEIQAAGRAILGENRTARALMERAASRGVAAAFLYLARLGWKEDPGGALRRAGRAIELDPRDGFARCFRGELLRRRGAFSAALSEIDAGFGLGAREPRIRIWRGKTLLALGRPIEALAELDLAVREVPRRARSRAERGYALEAAGRTRAAEIDYGAALRLERGGPLDLAETVETAESTEEMLAWLHFRRFVARIRLGDVEGGLRDLNRAHARDLKYSWRGRAEEGNGLALEELERIIAIRPRAGWLRAWRGFALNRDGRHAEAAYDLDRALACGVRSAWVHAWRAQALLRLGRDEEARADVRAAARRDGRYPLLFGLRSELALRRGVFGAAERRARQAIGAYPHAAWAYGLLGEALLGRGRRRQARAAFEQASAWSPDPRVLARLEELAAS